MLLLELFPAVAKTFLTDQKVKAYAAAKPAEAAAAKPEAKATEAAPARPKAVITGHAVTAPLPGRVLTLSVKVGDTVKAGQEVAVLEAMKMENAITTDYSGTVKQIFVAEGDNVPTDAPLLEVE